LYIQPTPCFFGNTVVQGDESALLGFLGRFCWQKDPEVETLSVDEVQIPRFGSNPRGVLPA
jgi:hypothetical protein